MAPHPFDQVAKFSSPDSKPDDWGPPQLSLSLGGQLAVWCEQVPNQLATDTLPWMVLHGGPGGSLGAGLVSPLRASQLDWFGFDQRNSGLSEDLPLEDIDTQRLLDDALAVADALGIKRFRVLAGSWGATLALMLAASAPERVGGLVLRAPFIPWRSRVDAFFAALEALAPERFANTFGAGSRTQTVCEAVLSAQGDALLKICAEWSAFEDALLSHRPLNGSGSALTEPSAGQHAHTKLSRKYCLQAHFLMHDCFTTPNLWQADLDVLNQTRMPVHLVQGQADRVCPPGGAVFMHELLPHSKLTLIPQAGHLATQPSMTAALAEAVSHMRWKSA